MNAQKVRLLSVTIRNLKNVVCGTFDFPKSKVESGFSETADVIGIYGQNGSGKTTVIQVMDLFRRIASGNELWHDMASCIHVDSESCLLEFRIAVETKKSGLFHAVYSCAIAKSIDSKIGPGFISEILALSRKNEDGSFGRMTPAFSFSAKNADKILFEPKNKFDAVVQGNQQRLVKGLLAKEMAVKEHKSFLFSPGLRELLDSSEDMQLADVVGALADFARFSLFAIQNSHSGIISIDAVIPMAIKHKFQGGTAIGDIPIVQQGAIVTDKETFKIVKSVLDSMDCVIGALVPGLSIKVKEYGSELLKNGTEGIRYEVVSERDGNGKPIPIRYESEGIRKLLSVLNVIIASYNNPSVCVAIDELDAGIFESLLGDLLKVFMESGKGQLVFSSHNLRPLEVLGKQNIIFTTANPDNRYIQLKNIRPSNNLRDCYIRALAVGGQDEELATETDTVTIRRALRKAGTLNAEA